MAAATKTVRDLIQRAFQKIGVYASGESIPADDMNDGLSSFQDIVAEWAADSMLIPAITLDVITLEAGKRTYTIGEGVGADIATVRPEQIVSAFVRQGTQEYPVDIIGLDAYNSFQDKGSRGDRPEYLYYSATAPNGTIKIYMPPASGGDYLYIWSLKPIQDSGGLTDDALFDLGIPRSYHNPIIYSIAVDIGPEYGKSINDLALLIQKAEAGKTRLRGINAANRIQAATIEFARGRGYNEDLVRYS